MRELPTAAMLSSVKAGSAHRTAPSKGHRMTNTYGFGRVAGWALALSLATVALSGCKGNAQPQTPPPPEVSVIEVRPHPVTVYDEYVAQTQAPDTIEIRSQVTGLLDRQAFADGSRVKKGDLLYIIDQRPFQAQLSQAKASLAQAEANLVNAKQNLARNSRLIAQRAVSQQDYDTAVAQERSSAALVEAQKALLRNVELNLEFATLRASRDGFMSSSQVKPGSLITAQQTLLTTLYSSDPMWVNFSISEDRLLELQKTLKHPPGDRPDQAPPFHIRLADGTDYALTGKLNFVDATLDPKSGTLQVRVSVPNPDRILRPGLFVRVIVAAYENPSAIRVPQQAVQELQGLKSVYVVGAGDKADPRQIVANYRLGSDWVVDSGLAAGDRVVTEGIGKLRPGTAVKPVVTAAVDSHPGTGPPPAAPRKKG
jgi:membrane fusion protein (multidrug efflux system)